MGPVAELGWHVLERCAGRRRTRRRPILPCGPTRGGSNPRPAHLAHQHDGDRHDLPSRHAPAGHPGDDFLLEAARVLKERYKIGHATLQIEIDENNACALVPDSVV